MRIPLLLALLIGAGPLPALAQSEAGGARPGWRFVVAPYFLAPHMNGTTTIRGHELSVDANPGDIFDRLKLGFMGYVEANNGRLGIRLDGLYMHLEETGTGPVAGVLSGVATMKQSAVELAGLLRLAPWAEVLAAGRLNTLSGGLVITGGPGPGVDVSQSHAWVDPVVGARLVIPETGRWTLALRGDIGGFGLGSDFAWQFYPRVEYRLSSLLGVALSYRVIDIDYENGEGTTLFRYDMTTFGPELDLTFSF